METIKRLEVDDFWADATVIEAAKSFYIGIYPGRNPVPD